MNSRSGRVQGKVDLAKLDESTQPPRQYPNWFSKRNADHAVAEALARN